MSSYKPEMLQLSMVSAKAFSKVKFKRMQNNFEGHLTTSFFLLHLNSVTTGQRPSHHTLDTNSPPTSRTYLGLELGNCSLISPSILLGNIRTILTFSKPILHSLCPLLMPNLMPFYPRNQNNKSMKN